ncbi:RNA polymerase sigma factor [Pedobacter sp. GR22-6]|uniref:RNA polymerase sigma factor n=1 Tax=Pedobacter sp. GR22-6 TaxID=3127957 RepID=UPI00307E2880
MKKQEQLSDQELIALLKQGNHDALAEIYQRYWAVLYIQARKMLQDEELARDIVQEVFIGLWSSLSVLNISSSLAAYLYASVRNKVLNSIRDNQVRSDYIGLFALYLDDHRNTTIELLEEKELLQAIEEIIQNLPSKMREVFELSRKDHLSHKQIAEQLGISEKTVKKQISNALGIMKDKLNKKENLILAVILWNFR